MENKEKQNYLPWVIVGVVILIFAIYVISSNKETSNQSNNVPVTDNTTDIVAQQNQVTPTPTPKQAPKQVTTTQPPSINYELSQNPEYLLSKTFNPNKVKAYGVGIGDLESSIDQSSIIRQQEYFGWVRTVNGVAYRIANGKVVEIALNEMAKKLGIYSESNIIMMFGQPDKIDTTSDYYNANVHYIAKQYYYTNKGLHISYNEGGMTSIGINVTGIY